MTRVRSSARALFVVDSTVAIVAFTFFVLPLYFMFQISVSTPESVLREHPPLFVESFTAAHWIAVFKSGNLWGPLARSFTVATAVTALSLLIGAPAAYVMARLPRRIGYTLILLVYVTRMLPEVSIALPISVTFLRLGLADTVWGLILAHLVQQLPMVTWILMVAFASVPEVLEEAAAIDGCGRARIMTRVVLPLAAPGAAVAAIFAWLGSWNEFIYAMYLTLFENTLPTQIYSYVVRGSWFQSATYTSILVVPVLIITLLFQRHVRTEYLAGAVKG